jgi:acetyltransferase
LLACIIEVARAEKLSRLFAEILPDNIEMQRVSEKLGLSLRRRMADGDVFAELTLSTRGQ